MPALNKTMRYAHPEGLTLICYDHEGNNMVTAGSDGEIRVYNSLDDSSHEIRIGEHVYALALSKEPKIFAASEDNCVKAYTYPKGSPDGLLLRFTSTINHITVSPSGTLLAAGSSDFNIKTIHLNDSTQKVYRGHEAPVLSMSLDPKEEFLASSSCDGTVRVWSQQDQSCTKTFQILPKSNDTSQSNSLCRLGWSPVDGKLLAVPVEKEIKIYERNTWNQVFSLQEHSEIVSVIAWSPCGQYLASASINGELIVWNMKSKKPIEKETHESHLTICSLDWNPKNNGEIAFSDLQGQIGILESAVIQGEVLDAASEPFPFEDDLEGTDNKDIFSSSLLDDPSDDEDLVGKKKPRRIKNAFLDDEAEDSNDGVQDKAEDDLDAALDIDGDDDEGDISKLKAELAVPMDFNDDETATNDGASVINEPKVPQYIGPPPVVRQAAFQPSSTPAHLTSRFMVWNSVGIVRCHTDEEISSIDVEFHDTHTHHAMHLTNHMNHTMAALSSTAVLLACVAQDDVPSKIQCLHFGSWDNSKQWTISMPVGENIQAIAVSDEWAAVVTDLRNLRLFSIGGLQRQVICLPGPVVCMSAHHSQLFLVYHSGAGLPEEQCYSFKLLDLRRQKQVVSNDYLPVTSKTTLSWLGFSAEGTPAYVDSKGIVRLLDRSFGNSWTPVANTKANIKGKSDNYWVVGLNENPQQLRCIYCKGSSYPPTLPRPVLVILPFQMQLCDLAGEKGQLEESYLRSSIFSNHLKYNKEAGVEVEEAAEDQSRTEKTQLLVKLFALACKSEREFRAVEVCELLPGQHEVSLAIKYAAKTRKMNLANRLQEVARAKAEEEMAEEEEEEYEEEQEDYPVRHHAPVNPTRGISAVNSRSQARASTQHEEEEEDEEMEDSQERTSAAAESADAVQRVSAASKNRTNSTSSAKVAASPLPSSQGARINPFKMGSDTKKRSLSTGKGFFDSVENEKTIMAEKAKASENKQPTKRRAKQGTLKSTKSPKGTKDQEKEIPVTETNQPKQKKVSPFNLWLSENKPRLQVENPEMDTGEVIKLAAKLWKELDPEQKKEWTEKAKEGSAKNNEKLPAENEEKKRKREDDDEEEKSVKNLDENQNSSNVFKKIKPVNTKPVNSKLAAFAFEKKN